MPLSQYYGGKEIAKSAASGVGHLFANQARLSLQQVAVQHGNQKLTYEALDLRVRRLSTVLVNMGVGSGDRIAILSENRAEYLEVYLAAAYIGAILACQNWRLTPNELEHCIGLVTPSVILVSPEHEKKNKIARSNMFWERL